MKLLLVATVIALLLAGCSGGGGSEPKEPTKDAQGRYVIGMPSATLFSPNNAKVPVGATVAWVNNVETPHDVTSATGLFDSDATLKHKMQKDEVFTYTFDQAGTYAYYCKIHESTGMKGTIVVA